MIVLIDTIVRKTNIYAKHHLDNIEEWRPHSRVNKRRELKREMFAFFCWNMVLPMSLVRKPNVASNWNNLWPIQTPWAIITDLGHKTIMKTLIY